MSQNRRLRLTAAQWDVAGMRIACPGGGFGHASIGHATTMHRLPLLLRTMSVATAMVVLTLATAGWSMAVALDRLNRGVGTTTDAIDTIDRSVEVAAEAIETVQGGLGSMQRMADEIGVSSEQVSQLTDEVATLTAERLSDSVRSIEDALPGLIQAAALMESSLGALGAFGIDYAPEVPLDESLTELHRSLDGLPEELTDHGRALGDIAPAVADVGADATRLAATIESATARLDEAAQLLGRYQGVVDDTRAAVDGSPGPRTALAVRVLVVLGAVSGLVLAYVLWRLAKVAEVVRMSGYFHASPSP